MELTFSETYEYIPTWNNNREQENPMTINCRYLTVPEREKYITMGYVSIDGELQRRTGFDYTGLIKASVVSIENLKVNGVAITSANQLVTIRGLSQLCLEIGEHISAMNVSPDLKN